MKFFITTLVFLILLPAIAQRGKDGNITISSTDTIVNEYTVLTADASAGTSSITVSDNTLDSSRFSSPLSPGDLIFIYQARGATIDGVNSGGVGNPNNSSWGAVLSYNNSGNYELLEVSSTSGTTIINFTCELTNDYTASGNVQVIRVPRFENLTIDAGANITTYAWDGNTGGIVVTEVNGTTTINGSITAAGKGFRGGQLDPNSSTAPHFATILDIDGAEKGESIAGYQSDYTINGGMYCMGAPANAGGGGNAHNAGGGGGANGGDPTAWTGFGNPDVSTGTWANAWNQEFAGFATSSSSGGGRGGYSFSSSNQNATTLGPTTGTWGGDGRQVKGGLGGRPMDYTANKIFFGGGGGAGDQNDIYGSPGARGGGIIYLLSHGTVTGSGQIIASGNNANDTYAPTPPFNGSTGKDGAGGGGGGGAVMINSSGAISGISITSNGGNGGDQNMAWGVFGFNDDAYGPGGGGGGGHIAISNGTITRTANGGANGTTNSTGLTEFPPNGATMGGDGTTNASITSYLLSSENDTICAGETATLTLTTTGTLPSGATITWYTSEFGSATAGTGSTFTTPPLATTTTYYAGICPGYYRIPVTVVVNPSPIIDTSAISITDESCSGSDGSITGIIVTGATTITWNGITVASPDLLNASSGSYTIAATGNGCTATAGPFIINTSGGPVINTSAISITQPSCGNANGSITGITAAGGTGTLTYSWNGVAASGPDTSALAPGTYTLTVTDGTGCSTSSGPHILFSSSTPVIDSTNAVITNASCGIDNGSITGITVNSGTLPYSFTWNGINSTADTSGIGPGTYTLTVTDASGCTDSSGPYIIVQNGGVTIDDNSVVISHTSCGQNNGSISGITFSGGTSPFTIDYNGITFTSTDVTGLTDGNYTLTITDNSGCSSTSGPYTIDPSSQPVISISATDPTCNGASDGSADATVTGGVAPYTFSWSNGIVTEDIMNLTAGNYILNVTDNSGCTASDSILLTEPAAIPLSVSGTTTICQGQSTTLTASGATIYSWSTGGTANSETISPASDQLVIITATDASCSVTDSIQITVNDIPVAAINGDLTICEGENTSLNATGGTSYLWNTTDTTSSITVSPVMNTTYSVVVSNNCGSDTASATISVNPLPAADAGVDATIASGNSTTLNPSGGIVYSWSPSTGLSCSVCQNPLASPASSITYTVTVTDANGCSSEDDVTITVEEINVLYIPDAFSPDGNGNNDILFVQGAGFDEFIFRIYDRWGQVIFETVNIDSGWDGTYKGEKLNAGVFIYTIEGKYLNGEEINQKGSITLVR